MSEKVPAVALFFDDADLGSHLRNALSEYGARIAHEGPIGSFDEAALRNAGVDVLVVNLDEAVDDSTLDRIYGLVKSGETPVVFNDAQASRGLDGWDRARWARHLAAKALNTDTIDPPRPDNAREVVAPPIPEEPVEFAPLEEHPVEDPIVDEPLVHDASAPDSETLAAELEALLASDEAVDVHEDELASGHAFVSNDLLPDLHDSDIGEHEATPPSTEEHAFSVFDDGFGSGLKFKEDDELPALHDGDFGESKLSALDAEDHAPLTFDENFASTLKFSEDDELPPLHDGNFGEHDAHLQSAASEPAPVEKTRFNIDYLSLADEEDETHLQELDTAFARLLVLGAARDSDTSLRAFLSTLSNDIKLPILLTQHQANGSAEDLVQSLASQSKLPVKVAAAGSRARAGEVLVVPRGQQVRVMRDGRVELSAATDTSEQSPSIDSSFTMAANVFGRDALAIVFAGKATDAVAGAQAIHDRGGQVWVESSAGDHYSDMVHGVLAERLASFSGSPQELAVRLVEDFR
jgi:chemosensory pili system protein ChpB (putative protein-glutamate methylesterase)